MAEPPVKRAKLDDDVAQDGVDHDALTQLQEELDRVSSLGRIVWPLSTRGLPLRWQDASSQRIVELYKHGILYAPVCAG